MLLIEDFMKRFETYDFDSFRVALSAFDLSGLMLRESSDQLKGSDLDLVRLNEDYVQLVKDYRKACDKILDEVVQAEQND